MSRRSRLWFSSRHVQLWGLCRKEGWVPNDQCFQSVVPESPLDCTEIQPVRPKGDQSWVFTGRTDAEAEAPILWPPDGKSQLTGKGPYAGKHWEQGMRWVDGIINSMTWVWANSRRQWRTGSLGCCSLWGWTQLTDWRSRTADSLWENLTKSHSFMYNLGANIHWQMCNLFSDVFLQLFNVHYLLISPSPNKHLEWFILFTYIIQ